MNTQSTRPLKPYVSEQAVKDLLHPYEQDIRDAIEYGIEQLRRLLTTEPYLATDASARAKIVNSAACHQLKLKWVNQDGIRRLTSTPHLAFVIYETIVLRLKNIDKQGRSRNYPTERHIRYMQQAQLDDMPPELPRVTAGYLVDTFKTTIADVRIILPSDISSTGELVNDWSFSIIGETEVNADGQVSMRLEYEPVRKPRIVAKKQPKTGAEMSGE
jgi:hypothetical protein